MIRLAIALAFVAAMGRSVVAQTPLTATDVIVATDRHLPLIVQARRDVDAAVGTRTAADGAFDLTLRALGSTLAGEYDNQRVSALVEQPLAAWGITAFGGYRAGRGDFAPYDSKSKTARTGEAVAGIDVPLLRGRSIDSRRAARTSAELGVDRAGALVEASRLTHVADALSRYWDWVAAGRQLQVARALLALAEARDIQLADAVALGQLAPIERTDNQRAILQRRSALVAAERQFELQSIGLSLYYRDAGGQPQRPTSQQVPMGTESSASALPAEADVVTLALAQRPEVVARRLERARTEVDVQLAANGLLPRLDAFAEATRDGDGSERSGSALEVGLSFSWPVQRRVAAGDTAKARAASAKATLDLQWAEDRVRAEVQDALSAARAAQAILSVVADEVAVARELERLERDRFDLGDSSQFLVNLRELSAADAALREVRARADLEKALVELDAATGALRGRLPAP